MSLVLGVIREKTAEVLIVEIRITGTVKFFSLLVIISNSAVNLRKSLRLFSTSNRGQFPIDRRY